MHDIARNACTTTGGRGNRFRAVAAATMPRFKVLNASERSLVDEVFSRPVPESLSTLLLGGEQLADELYAPEIVVCAES